MTDRLTSNWTPCTDGWVYSICELETGVWLILLPLCKAPNALSISRWGCTVADPALIQYNTKCVSSRLYESVSLLIFQIFIFSKDDLWVEVQPSQLNFIFKKCVFFYKVILFFNCRRFYSMLLLFIFIFKRSLYLNGYCKNFSSKLIKQNTIII